MSLQLSLFLLAALSSPIYANEQALIGHWRLAGDVLDSSGNSRHGENHGADLKAPGRDGTSSIAAKFNGADSYIEIPNCRSLAFGTDDLTISVWVHTDSKLGDTIGDVISKFDPATRRGVNLCVKNSPGTSGSQSNYRNIHFGIDSGTEPTWRDCGRPGNAVYVTALATHEGALYAGTCEPDRGEAGHVYVYDGGTAWIDCGRPDESNTVTTLAVFNGKLYAGTGCYNLSGSAMPASPNTTPGGKVFRYGGGRKWVDCGKLGSIDAVGGLVVYKGDLYATSMYHPAGFFRYQSGQEWEPCPLPADGRRVVSPAVFNGSLYAATYDGCAVYRFDGESWSGPVVLEPHGQTYSLEVHAGKLCAGTWPSGRVYTTADGSHWSDAGQLGNEEEVMGMAVYNGKLYGGTLPLAEVYRYDDGTKWTFTGKLDDTPDVRFRRAWSMSSFSGKLFCGTLPSGRVRALNAGACVTDDRELPPGWRHLAAIRRGDSLEIYVDGVLVATSSNSRSEALDLTNDHPLRIGAGEHDYFCGSLSELRIYQRALEGEEIAKLARLPRNGK